MLPTGTLVASDTERTFSDRRLTSAYGQKLTLGPAAGIAMKAKHFIVATRPRLAEITKHPKVSFADYERELRPMQSTLQAIQQAYLGTRERAVVVLEGWDASGKGGVVRRLAWALDPRSFKVYPVAAPKSHEQGKHYLQRFWEKLPSRGEIVVFDRSWYGRVLVERVEKIANKREWLRGYEEINQFEQMLVADGIRVVKCFLHITPEEQIRRFKDRLANPWKRWKLTFEDLRNRSRWADYEFAIGDMMSRLQGRFLGTLFQLMTSRTGVLPSSRYSSITWAKD
jgi:AMP-polyphosphate phosphotransferase